jgi:cyclopropane fatty-acyl-phospholipid synthase-like methyltransferase
VTAKLRLGRDVPIYVSDISEWRRAYAAELGGMVGDVGSGTGRLAPYLAARGLTPHGVDLSPEMVERCARRFPGAALRRHDITLRLFDEASIEP